MNFGKWIVVSFILFAGFIAGLVIVCIREDISLVSRTYYQEELKYQDQIDRLNNAARLASKPSIRVVSDSLKISFSEFGRVQSGEITLFRPSDPKHDRRFTIAQSQDAFRLVSLQGLPGGMYKARMAWVMDGKEYFIEDTIYY